MTIRPGGWFFYDFFKAGPKFAVETFLVFWH